MASDIEPIEASHRYAAAYAAHYVGRDLPLALQLYGKLIESHPNCQEADYSRTQVHNIVSTVIPKQELLDAQMDLARGHFKQVRRLDDNRGPDVPTASRVPT